MDYRKTYTPAKGYTELCTIGKCSLERLEFGIIELGCREELIFDTKDREAAFVLLGGTADFVADGCEFLGCGKRRTVFEGKTEAVYMPRGRKVTIRSRFKTKIAVCKTPVGEDSEPQYIRQEDVRMVRLGVKPWERDTTFILDASTNARKLTVGEAYITPGNWAGFPPHKHDCDDMPSEGVLEEIYYFLFDPGQGFGIQCFYTADGSVDVAYRVRSNDLVEFPRGYHTTVGAPGYNSYFLWLMAGEHQGFYRSSDPDHAWVSAVENMVRKM